MFVKIWIIPVQKAGTSLVVAFSDPSNIFVRDDLGFITRSNIKVVVATESAIGSAIEKYFGANVSKTGGNRRSG